MKVAFLITAYNQPKHLHRLVKAMTHPDFHFFIHIDKKIDITPFKALDFGERVTFLEDKDRITVFHGGFTATLSLISLLKVSYESGDFDYACFISGSDYPIKPVEYIYNFLKASHPTNFIDFYPLLDNAKGAKNFRHFHFEDMFGKQPPLVKKYLRFAERLACDVLPERKFIKGIIPYRGSTWVCLNRETVSHVLDFVSAESSREFMNYFKWVWGADEIFLHTIILNSPHAKECRHYDPEIYASSCINQRDGWRTPNKGFLHYIDWSPDREDPAVLTMDDFDALKDSNHLFARKFFEKESAEVLDKIDKYLLSIWALLTQTGALAHSLEVVPL